MYRRSGGAHFDNEFRCTQCKQTVDEDGITIEMGDKGPLLRTTTAKQ
jgi:hypothetical protein